MPSAPKRPCSSAVFVLLGILNAYGYMMLADTARDAIRRPHVLRLATRIGAGFLIGAGVASLFARRAA